VNNGVLTVILNEEQTGEIARRSAEIPDYDVTISLEDCQVRDKHGFSASFSIDEFSRHCLLHGLDHIGLTLQYESEISAYEARHSTQAPLSR
jgi:3-isopropylmalate/(R)-2-methylmalate dehydratase small subunit